MVVIVWTRNILFLLLTLNIIIDYIFLTNTSIGNTCDLPPKWQAKLPEKPVFNCQQSTFTETQGHLGEPAHSAKGTSKTLYCTDKSSISFSLFWLTGTHALAIKPGITSFSCRCKSSLLCIVLCSSGRSGEHCWLASNWCKNLVTELGVGTGTSSFLCWSCGLVQHTFCRCSTPHWVISCFLVTKI